MKHEIDLSNYEIRTDLAIDEAGNQSKQERILEDNITVTKMILSKEETNVIDKKKGTYVTIEFLDITDTQNRQKVEAAVIKQLRQLLEEMGMTKNSVILVVGLGNDKSTPDALGPLAIEEVIVTRHLYEIGDVDPRFRNVAAISPGVMGETGIETIAVIKGVVDEVKPDFILVIDALKSSSISRVNKTIQITDTGIHPGSGVGNKRKEISKETIGVPVIAIGIPTVVDLVTVVSDTVKFMHQHFSYTKSNHKKPSSRLVVSGTVNYLEKEVTASPEDKVELLGLLGYLTEEELKQLFIEVLTPVGYNLIVTPKEIDFLIKKQSQMLASSLNQVLHQL